MNPHTTMAPARPRARRLTIGLIAATAAAIPIAAVTHAATPSDTPMLSVDDPTIDLAAGAAEVQFTVTLSEQAAPTTTTTTATSSTTSIAPVTTPSATTPPPATPPAGELPETGTAITPLVIAAAALVAVGFAVVAIRRRPGALPVIVIGTTLAATITVATPAFASGPPTEPAEPNVTVSYRTIDGTATAPDDYTATTGTLTFTDGQTTAVITVPINPTGTGGTFTVELHNPTGATLADPTGSATLLPPPPPTTTPSTSTTIPTTTSTTIPTTTSTTTTTTSTTIAPVEGCVNPWANFSYLAPAGTALDQVTVDDPFSPGDDATVDYALIEGWYSADCTGDARPLATFFFPGGLDPYSFAAMNELYPGSCSCGQVQDAVIDGLGVGQVYWLTM